MSASSVNIKCCADIFRSRWNYILGHFKFRSISPKIRNSASANSRVHSFYFIFLFFLSRSASLKPWIVFVSFVACVENSGNRAFREKNKNKNKIISHLWNLQSTERIEGKCTGKFKLRPLGEWQKGRKSLIRSLFFSDYPFSHKKNKIFLFGENSTEVFFFHSRKNSLSLSLTLPAFFSTRFAFVFI